jgi:hypothetical protein
VHLGGVVRPPGALAAPHTAKRKAKKSEAFPFAQIDKTAFVFMKRHMKCRQLFAEALFDRPQQPVMPPMPIDSNQQ